MERQALKTIAQWSQGRLLNASSSAVVQGLTTDSRAVKKGDLFLALAGEKFDGHDFLLDVCAMGAAAAVVEERRSAALPSNLPCIVVEDTRKALGAIAKAYRQLYSAAAIAIAGSNGKTSTKELVAAVLSQRLRTLWSPASFNNDIGVPLTILQLTAAHQAGVFEV